MAATDVNSVTWNETVLKSSVPVIVDFWASWCPWCMRLMPDFDLLSNDFDGRLMFVKVNTEEAPEIASRYGVQSLPTLKFFCGGQPVEEIIGYMPRTSLKAQFETMLTNHPDCFERSSLAKH